MVIVDLTREQTALAGPAQAPTRHSSPDHHSLLDVFSATVELYGTRVAIDAEDATLTYYELDRAVEDLAGTLREHGIGPGDRVGIRLQSGSSQLYIAILGVLAAGAAYVPVDADDPPARIAGIWEQAEVCGVLENGLCLRVPEAVGTARPGMARRAARSGMAAGAASPGMAAGAGRELSDGDDAWIIFTSGSTGQPKGVAVTHHSAAAFVRAEKLLWSVHPEDRVLAGLSVAFDASCEEMWLAWANGAALVPAPRALVRSGVDVGPWLTQREISVISTVPTLAAMWDEHTLAGVRLLILGGEACSTELGWRLAASCELWNTYGPTEATVVSTAARVLPGKPVTIGWPLAGWDVAVVDEQGLPVAAGEPGELAIGGVGLARYLDPSLDAERYAGLPSLGWERAYRSGDIVRDTAEGLQFIGRRDHQVKLAGRRLELGEVEAQLSAVAGVRAAAAAVQKTAAHNKVLVGYVVGDVNPAHVRAAVAELLPDGLAPVVVVLEEMPTTRSGKIDRKALPWPPADAAGPIDPSLSGTAAWLARRFTDQLGPVAIGLDTDFFACGGSSLAAAKLVSVLRERFPSVAVADVYEHRLLGQLATRLDELTQVCDPAGVCLDERGELSSEAGEAGSKANARPHEIGAAHGEGAVPARRRRFAALQIVGVLVLTALAASQWVLGAFAYGNIESDGLPHVGWAWLIGAWVLLASPIGRLGLAVAARRLLLGELRPGRYPRASWLACRVWFLERLGEYCHLTRLAGTPFSARYARLMGADVDPDARIASMPTLTSLVHIGPGATVESQVDLHGWWIDGRELVIGEIHIGAGASVGSRTLLAPGASVGEDAEIEPGSVISGAIPAGEHWGGSPARYLGPAGESWPSQEPPPAREGRLWRALYSASLMWEGLLVLLALVPGVLLLVLAGAPAPSLSGPLLGSLAVLVGEAAVITGLSTVVLALLVALTLRLVWKLVRPGLHGEGGALSWALWFSGDLGEATSAILFPLYASLYTRGWLRLMGMRVGRRTEISTSTGLSPLVSFGELSHATDDVGFCTARSRGGWLRLEPIEIGSRTFLGPGAVLREGTRLGDDSLIGALTLAPRRPEQATSWLGVPAFELPRVRASVDPARTVRPPRRLVLARAAMDALRILGPNTLSLSIGLFDLLVLDLIGARLGIPAMIALSPLVVLGSGLFSAALAVAIKWTLIGRYRSSEHPLWSFFVWRDEIVNTSHEQLAGEWLLRFAIGTPLMSLYLRAMGSKIGRGVWCETTAITEYDVVSLGDGCAINRGSCLMTHVFQDRLLSIGPTSIGAGATMGPTSAVLPDTALGARAYIGAHSVVLRGETLPPATRWHGAPVVSAT
jgi:non-ribosomal peptide synthetase-like protein